MIILYFSAFENGKFLYIAKKTDIFLVLTKKPLNLISPIEKQIIFNYRIYALGQRHI